MLIPDFFEVRRVPKSYWFMPHYLGRAQPGDILLLGEPDDKTGGIIKIRATAVFLSLTPGQAWGGERVLWPREADGIEAFVIKANGEVEFIPRKNSGEGPPATIPTALR